MLTLVIPVYKNEGSIPDLLSTVAGLHQQLDCELKTIFVIDGSPDRCYELLRDALPSQPFQSKLALLSRNFGSFAAIRAGLELGESDRYAVMAADLQEPPELVLEMDKVLRSEPIDIVVGTREGRNDPLSSRIPAQLFWWLYRKYVIQDVPPGGVDVFGCNRAFRDTLLKLDERHSSLIAQIFWPIGVWASVLGSVLLLLRSRHAVLTFLISLVGAVVSFGFQMTVAVPASMVSPANKLLPIAIVVVILLLWWYSRRQVAAGVLH